LVEGTDLGMGLGGKQGPRRSIMPGAPFHACLKPHSLCGSILVHSPAGRCTRQRGAGKRGAAPRGEPRRWPWGKSAAPRRIKFISGRSAIGVLGWGSLAYGDQRAWQARQGARARAPRTRVAARGVRRARRGTCTAGRGAAGAPGPGAGPGAARVLLYRGREVRTGGGGGGGCPGAPGVPSSTRAVGGWRPGRGREGFPGPGPSAAAGGRGGGGACWAARGGASRRGVQQGRAWGPGPRTGIINWWARRGRGAKGASGSGALCVVRRGREQGVGGGARGASGTAPRQGGSWADR
jgi:hypothetical protein